MTADRGIVIVTGANGRIGTAVMERLGRRFEVVGTDRRADRPPPPGCVFLPIDFRSDETVQEGLRVIRDHHGVRVLSVVHLVAYYSFSEERSPMYEEVTVRGTARLLRGLRDVGFTVEQFIFSSTMLVHRPTRPGAPITEDSPMEATWAYPESKIKTEALIQEQRGVTPAVFLRIAGVYDDECHSIPLANQIQRIYERQFTSRFYSGEIAHGQSFVHMDDTVDAIERAVGRRSDLPAVAPLLIGEPETLSYDELQHSFARLIYGEDWETREVPGPLAKIGAWFQNLVPGKKPFIKPWMIDRANDHYELDVSRARTLLGWEPRHSLRETLPKMVAALKSDPLAWYEEHGLDAPGWLRKRGGRGPGPPGDDQGSSPPGPAHDSHEAHENHEMDGSPARTPGDRNRSTPGGHDASTADQSRDVRHGGSVHTMHGEAEWGGTPSTSQQQTASEPTVRGIADPRTNMRQAHGAMVADGSDRPPPAPNEERNAPHEMMERDQATVWAHFFAVMGLGVWLITSPFALEYGDRALLWSDVGSGAALIALATVTIARRSTWASWAVSLVGVWLLFAPLVFSAPNAGAYANDTLVGTLAIVFAILMPGMPGLMHMLPGPDRPPGWTYNPSTWPQRAPIIVLAFLGFILSRQMAAYQLGYTDSTWEPFFDPGTKAVLDSDVSRAFPISDAGFGGVAYMIEALMGFMGDRRRWRTMPWMVTFFGILVVPLGMVSITLIILQPVAVGDWCTPCLLAALAMLVMIALTLDEVVAMGLFLLRARREGQSLWRVFWQGGTLSDAEPAPGRVHRDIVSGPAMVWGVALPWNLLASAGIGLWLMGAPSALGSTGAAAHSDHLVGALVVSVAVMAFADVGRSLRFVNLLLGTWIVISPWLLDGATTGAVLSGLLAGLALILLSVPRGPVGERYGAWQPYVR